MSCISTRTLCVCVTSKKMHLVETFSSYYNQKGSCYKTVTLQHFNISTWVSERLCPKIKWYDVKFFKAPFPVIFQSHHNNVKFRLFESLLSGKIKIKKVQTTLKKGILILPVSTNHHSMITLIRFECQLFLRFQFFF